MSGLNEPRPSSDGRCQLNTVVATWRYPTGPVFLERCSRGDSRFLERCIERRLKDPSYPKLIAKYIVCYLQPLGDDIRKVIPAQRLSGLAVMQLCGIQHRVIRDTLQGLVKEYKKRKKQKNLLQHSL